MEENQEFFEENYVNQTELQSRKKVAVVFVKDMIEDNTNCSKSFTSTDIINRLDRYPYSLRIERRAVSNIINLLSEEYPYIRKDEATGRVWYDRTLDKRAG